MTDNQLAEHVKTANEHTAKMVELLAKRWFNSVEVKTMAHILLNQSVTLNVLLDIALELRSKR